MMHQLKKTGHQEAASVNVGHVAGPEDVVSCDFCTATKVKAVKSCLVCLASYCADHLRPHCESAALRKHTLVEASVHLEEKICSRHDKLLEIYCRTDQRCVCLLCVMDEHRGHDTVSTAAERADRQKQLGRTKRKGRLRIQVKEKELLDLRRVLESLKLSARAAAEESERIFLELLSSVERRRAELRELIRRREEAAVGQARDLLARLELELADLRRTDAGLDRLSRADDHIYFLQNCQSICTGAEFPEAPSITVVPPLDFGKVRSSVSALQRRLEDLFKGEWPKISRAASSVKLLQCPEPRIRAEFLYYSCQFTLDPTTAHRDLSLSQQHRAVTVSSRGHSFPNHPGRFDYWCQVLSREALPGRCYWEAEWNGGGAKMAVAYHGIAREGEGNGSHYGHNDKSWSLFCSRKWCTFWHDNAATRITTPTMSSRIGVYLDQGAGTLAFYSVTADCVMTQLHRIQTTFTQPLYPGFELMCFGASVRLCQIE